MKKSSSYEKVLSVDEFNDFLATLDYYDNLEVKQAGICMKVKVQNITYYCSLTGKKEDTSNTGNIWRNFTKYTPESMFTLNEGQYGKKTTKLLNYKTKVRWDIRDPGNFAYSDESRSRRWLKCYSYDVNSAYSYAMTKPIPDTSKPPRLNSIVSENEIGFYNSGDVVMAPGAYAEYIFPLIESPFKDFVNNYYAKKQQAKTKEERKNWKIFLNIPSGMMHKRNIFIRNTILYYAREYIRGFMDDDTVYCNTDSIVSLKRRPDLPLGDKLGEFKEERVNEDFKYIKSGIYQWGTECHYEGIPGCTLTDIEDIKGWKDRVPYKYDNNIRRIVKNG